MSTEEEQERWTKGLSNSDLFNRKEELENKCEVANRKRAKEDGWRKTTS